MADWGAWKNSSPAGNELLSLYSNCSQLSPSLYNNLCVNGSFTPSPSKLESKMSFCDKDNIDQCASILNQELMMLGLQSVYGAESDAVDLCCLINCCHDLITQHHKAMHEKEELENRYHRLLSDLDQSQTLQARLKADLDQSQRQCAQCQEKERQQSAKNRTLTAKLKSEKEEVKRLKSVMTSRDLQYKHDLKKKEREANKLKERLHQVLMDKKHERQIGMSIANAVQRTDGRRSTWRTGTNKQEEEMYRSVISNYEDRQQILMLENAKLRDTLQSMQTEIVSLLNQQDSPLKASVQSESPEVSLSCSDDDVSVGASECSVLSTDKLSEGLYQMPYDMVQKDIEKNFHDTCRMLKEVVKHSKKKKLSVPVKKSKNTSNGEIKMSSTPVSNGITSRENVEELVDKLTKYKWLVKEQEEFIQQSLHSQSQSVENSFLHDSQLLHDKESLAEERRRLYQAKARFEDERKQLTEAAIRLSRQRKDLEDEKARVLQQQFLQFSPFVSDSDRSTVLKSKEGSRLLPSTPTYTTSPSMVVTGPSPTDLYRAMGLNHHVSQKIGNVNSKPPMSPQISKAPSSGSVTTTEAPMGASPCKRNSSGSIKLSPMPSVENMSHSLDSLKKTLFNGKPKRSSSRQSLN
ncbi:afadin- and alpha-actinin-binding protein B-like [Liolophura sinensis]|uniref:afadin- and alpha-actinin-binding protein B-like n=1 Tax=Liolophura sinensis TaxID=3198878 RepID=UPI00315924F2